MNEISYVLKLLLEDRKNANFKEITYKTDKKCSYADFIKLVEE